MCARPGSPVARSTLERLAQRRDGLDRGPHDDRLAVAHAALDAAGAVRRPTPVGAGRVDLVVDRAAAPVDHAEAQSDLDALDRRDPHDRARQRAVEPRVPLRRGAEADRHPSTTTTNEPPIESPASFAASTSAIMARSASGSGQRSGVGSRRSRVGPAVGDGGETSSASGNARIGPSWSTKLQIRTPHAAEQLARERAGHDAGGGRACRGTLEHVADVVGVVLDGAGEVDVAGPRQRDRLRAALGRDRLDRHPLGPVLPVAVVDGEAEGRAERAAVAEAGGPAHPVALDLHPLAAAVAVLPPLQVAVDQPRADPHAGRHALEDADEPRPVRLARGQQRGSCASAPSPRPGRPRSRDRRPMRTPGRRARPIRRRRPPPRSRRPSRSDGRRASSMRAASRRAAAHAPAVGQLRHLGADGLQPRDHGAMRSDSLTRSSPASRSSDSPVAARHGDGEQRQLVDEVGDLVVLEVGRPAGGSRCGP